MRLEGGTDGFLMELKVVWGTGLWLGEDFREKNGDFWEKMFAKWKSMV